jgi:hypothetical protein
VSARTAPWIARFFEADDRFATTADEELFPIRHSRSLREGRRAVGQQTTFDPHSGRVQSVDVHGTPTGPALRAWPHARDVVSALFYARTLTLASATPIEFPVFESGRNVVVRLEPRGVEALVIAGRSWATIRSDVVLEERVPRRRAPEITVWLARDPPRPLVAAEVRAVFGNLRIELADTGGRR